MPILSPTGMNIEAFERNKVRGTLERVQEVLVDACGPDKRLSKADLETALGRLAPSERVVVDEFAQDLRARNVGGIVTVSDIERATKNALKRVAPKTIGGKDAPADVSAEDVQKAATFGAGLMNLAARLAGDWRAVLPALPPIDSAEIEGKANAELLAVLRERATPHLRLSYGTARDVMFSFVDNQQGTVREVYTGREVPTASRADMAANHQINTEHTHPRSLGVDGTPALSDLHHLFPTDSLANGKRSSLPFGTVVNVTWEKDGSKLGMDANGKLVFEPPAAHQGDTARAMFYIAAVYGLAIPADEEAELRAWHKLDPVDEREQVRNEAIAQFQENRNPFVDLPDLVDRIEDF